MSAREPFIGVTCDVDRHKAGTGYNLFCDYRYPEAVKQAGGFPVILPIASRPNVLRRCVDGIDGLIIVGGDDVEPRLYGERPKPGTGLVFGPRLAFERRMYLGARRRRLPVLGICYGMQLINVLEGGALFQDIRRDARSTQDHRSKGDPLNAVRVAKDSRLRRILGCERTAIHCSHHQAVSRVAPGFKPVAFADDGIIEAIESDREEVLAVQWHPERTLRGGASRRLFRYFISLCRR